MRDLTIKERAWNLFCLSLCTLSFFCGCLKSGTFDKIKIELLYNAGQPLLNWFKKRDVSLAVTIFVWRFLMTKIFVSPGRSTAGRHNYIWAPLVLSILLGSNKTYIVFAGKSSGYCVLPFQFSLASRPKNFFPVRVLCCLKFSLISDQNVKSPLVMSFLFLWGKWSKVH